MGTYTSRRWKILRWLLTDDSSTYCGSVSHVNQDGEYRVEPSSALSASSTFNVIALELALAFRTLTASVCDRFHRLVPFTVRMMSPFWETKIQQLIA